MQGRQPLSRFNTSYVNVYQFLATISYAMEEKRAMCSLILPVTNAKVKKIQAEQLKKQQQEQENAATTVATE